MPASRYLSRFSLAICVLSLCAVSLLFTLSASPPFHFGPLSSPGSWTRSRLDFLSARKPGRSHRLQLGIFSHIFVVSLERRQERRETMESLRKALDLEWTYVDATEAESAVVDGILRRVWLERQRMKGLGIPELDWPTSLASISNDAPNTPKYWHPFRPHSHSTAHRQLSVVLPHLGHDFPSDVDLSRLTCAQNDTIIPLHTPNLPWHKLLSRGMVACWHSHLGAIGAAVEESSAGDATLILEDDVDMEWDIQDRLLAMWPDLPPDWDMVLLGHCWSDESRLPAVNNTALHPSTHPKCNHAYAISRAGARKLHTFLSYPPFAYSRALDQATAHLIASGRVKAFSVVPSIVVQTKESASDILGGRGSVWKEELDDSALANIWAVQA